MRKRLLIRWEGRGREVEGGGEKETEGGGGMEETLEKGKKIKRMNRKRGEGGIE